MMNNTFELYLQHEHRDFKASTGSMQSALNQQLDDFLRREQKQAYGIALFSVKQEADALDVVQETMLSFVKYYRNKQEHAWRPLFYRVLQNKITDHHRKRVGWIKHFFVGDDNDDAITNQVAPEPLPETMLETQLKGHAMMQSLQQLPNKQRQVVIYRHWLEMTVNETAKVMNISGGSVKTHLFRATQKLKQLTGNDHE